MSKANALDTKVMQNVAKHGFTFKGDNLFRTIRQASTCLNRLVSRGWLAQEGSEYRITDEGRDAYSSSMGTEDTLTQEYRQLKARASELEASLPNAREIGLAAYTQARKAFDNEFNACVKRMREIEDALSSAP